MIFADQSLLIVTAGSQGPAGPPGPAGSGGGADSIIASQSGETVITLLRGMPVAYVAGKVVRASATTQPRIYGFVYDATIGALGSGNIAVGGVLTATTAEWDAVTGSSGGLVPYSVYFLTSTPGQIGTVPSLANTYLMRAGYALSATQLKLQFDSPITL